MFNYVSNIKISKQMVVMVIKKKFEGEGKWANECNWTNECKHSVNLPGSTLIWRNIFGMMLIVYCHFKRFAYKGEYSFRYQTSDTGGKFGKFSLIASSYTAHIDSVRPLEVGRELHMVLLFQRVWRKWSIIQTKAE